MLVSTASFAGSSTEPDLSITIDAAENPVLVKSDIEYSIVVKNNGSVGAIDSKVTTTIPSSLNYSFGGSGWSCDRTDDTVTCTYSGVLDAGATANTLTLTRETTTTGTVTQNVSVSATNGDYDTSNNDASAAVDVGQTNLQITKSTSDTQVETNQDFTYTIAVSNPTSGTTLTATDIVVTDTIPSGFSITSVPTGCSASGQDITCNIASLSADGSQSFVIGVKAPSSIPSTNPVTNTATLDRTGYVSSTNKTELPTSDSVNVTVTAADVTVSLSASPSPVPISNTLTYTVNVSNLNGVDANDVNVSVTLDNDLTYQSDSAGCSRSGQTLTCSLGTVSGNGNRSFTVTTATPATHQTVTTTADVVTSTAETDTTNNSASLDTAVEGADLRITKSGPDSAAVLTDITYTITVYNDGIADAQNVVVTDTLDNGMAYVGDTAGCSQSGQTLTCSLGTLASSSNTSFNITVTTPNKTGTTVNSVSVDTTTDENNAADKTASKTTTLITPNLNIAKSNSPTEVGIGGAFTYSISVTNSENAVAQDATITDTLPAGVTVTGIASNPDGWNCSSFPITGDGSATFTCTLATFAANDSSTITFNATAPDATGDYQNRARIGHSLDSNDDEDTSTLTVSGVHLTVTKSASATAVAGGTIDYEITVTNDSLTDAETLTLTDDLTALGAGYTLGSVTDAGGWSCSGTTTLTCTRNTLAAGGSSSTIKFRVNVPVNATLGTVTNDAEVHVDSPQSLDFSSNSASTEIQGADIVVTKSGDTYGIANETVNVNVIVTNQGNAVAKDVNVTIDLNTNNIADFTEVETDCGTGTFMSVSEPFTCQLGDIGKNGSVTVAVRAKAPNYDSNFPGHSEIANNATAVTSTSQSDTGNDSRNWNIEIRGADLVVYKTPSANEVAVGGTVTYTISVTNQGDATATDITLDDSVVETTDGLSLSNLQYNGSDWSCTTNFPTGFHCTYQKNLASGQSTSDITVDATAPNSDTALDQTRSNEVNVSNDTAESDTATTNSKVSPVTIRGAELTISKTVDKSTVALGEQVTFAIRVNSTGLAEAKSVEVNDTLPNGFTAISTNGCNNDGSAVSGQTVHCLLGDLAANNGSASFTITANAPTINGDYTNTATTGTDTPESNTQNNDDDALVHVEGADLVPYKAAPARVAGNSEFGYTISIRNIGRSSAYGAEFNDTIPTNNGTTYVSGSLQTLDSHWTCSLNAGTVQCHTIDSNYELPSGYNEQIASFRVKAGPAHYFINNTVVVGTDTSESDTDNNDYTAVTEVIDIDLAASKPVVAPSVVANSYNNARHEYYAPIGETITYELRVSNVSPVNLDITDVNVTDVLPNNATNISVTPGSDFTCNSASNPGDTLLCTMNSGVVLTQNETKVAATVTLTVIDAAHFDTGDENNNYVINRFKAETILSDQDLANNAPTTGDGYLHTDTLVRGANVSVDKSGPNQAGAEQNLTYTLDVRNWPRSDQSQSAHDIPSTAATGVIVKDTLPAEVAFVSANGTNWSCNESGGIVTCTYSGDMAPANTSHAISITVTAPNQTGITVTNEANVTTSTPELTRLLADNHDSLDTDIVGTDIVVIKTGTATAGMGDELTYTIRVDNNSTVPASGIHVDDVLHTDVNLSAAWDRDLTGSGWSCVFNAAEHNVSCDYSGTLTANSSTSFTLYTVAPDYTGTIRNRAVATTTTAETNKPNISDFDTVIEGAEVGFASDPFQQSPNPVGALRPIDYNLTVINRGHSEARDINLTMQFPGGFDPEFEVTSTGGDSGWNCDFNATTLLLTCHLPTLAPNNATSRVEVHAIAPNANQDVSYTVHVEGTDGSGQVTQETLSSNPVTTVKGADLKIKKYVQDLENPGYDDTNVTAGLNKYVEFNITVENRELGLAKDLMLVDNFDSAFTDLSISSQTGWNGTCAINGQNLQCVRDELLSGTTLGVVVKAKTPGVEGIVDNNASVNNTTVQTDTTNDTDSAYVKVEGSRFSVDINVSKTLLAFDEEFRYAITVVNTGKTEAEDINVSDTLPAGFTYVGSDGSDAGWSCTSGDGNRTLLCQLDSLAGYNGTTLLVLNTKAPQTIGKYTNEITVDSPSVPAPVNASADEVEVRGADLNVTLTASDSEILEEHNTTVTFVVKNSDISTAYDVNVTQTFTSSPAGTFVQVDNTTDCTVTATQIECHWDTLAPDENETVTVTLTAPAINADTTLTTHVSAVTATQEPDTNNNEASVNIDVKAIVPVANWRMDECSWGTVVDQTGKHPGTAHGDADTVNKILTKDVDGRISFYRAGSFDGDGDYVAIPNSDEINTADHYKRSISVWFKADDTNARQMIYEEGGTVNALAIYIEKGKIYIGGFSKSYDWKTPTYINTAIDAEKWHHVVLVLDAKDDTHLQADALRAYLDGNLIASGPASKLKKHPGNISIGHNGDGIIDHHNKKDKKKDDFKGFVDELKIFNIALDDTAVVTLYDRESHYINFDGTQREAEMVCQVDAEVTLNAPSDVPVESNFDYTITVNNLTLEPIEELNLTIQLPTTVSLVDTNFTTMWNSCIYDEGTSTFTCRFSDDGNISNAWFYENEELIVLTVAAPNAIVSLDADADITTYPEDEDMDNNHADVTTQTIGTNIKVEKRVDLTTPALNAPFVYTVSVTNDSTVDARDVNVTDVIPSVLSIASTTHEGWTDFLENNGTVRARLSLLPAGETKYFTVTVSSPQSGTVVNTAHAVTATVETAYDDNNGSVSVNVGGVEGNTTVILKDGFSLRYNTTKYGDFVTIGNTYLTSDSNTSALLADIDASAHSPSKAKLELPYDDNITVIYARLYWTGHLHGEAGDPTSVETTHDYNEITFHTPKGSYNISADQNETYYYYNKTQYDTYRRIYACSADVTSMVKEVLEDKGTYNGLYGVSDLKANTGKDDPIFMTVTDNNTTTIQAIKIGHFGGWSLAVFYEVDHKAHRDQVFKDMTIHDGFKKLIPAAVGYDKLVIPFSGFLTPYGGETIDSRLTLFSGGGEVAKAFDYLSILKVDNNVTSEVNVTDALNPEDNVLNGTISQAGEPLTPRYPNLTYSLGIDMDQFDISSDFTTGEVYLGHLQQDTNITLHVGREKVGNTEEFDQAFPSLIGLSTEINNPDFIDSYKECFVERGDRYIPCADTNITRGSELIYRITIINTGNMEATKVSLFDPLPPEVNYVDDLSKVKVVSITMPLCSDLDGSNEKIAACKDWLSDKSRGYFDKSTGLTENGKLYLKQIDINASNNMINIWDANFPADLIHDTNKTQQELYDEGYLSDEEYALYPSDTERELLEINLSGRLNYSNDDNGTFPALHVSWVEFRTVVNYKASLYSDRGFMNKAIIQFTNQTLEAAGRTQNATQRQESASAESPPVVFNWEALDANVSDPFSVHRTVGTKIVNKPFDLNISIDDSNSTLVQYLSNYSDVNVSLWGIVLADRSLIPPGGTCDTFNSSYIREFSRNLAKPVDHFDLNSSEYISFGQLSSAGLSWKTTPDIFMATARRDVTFCLQFKIRYKKADGTVGEEVSPGFYGPFGDDFAVRPWKFDISSSTTVASTANADTIIKAGEDFSLGIIADDGNGSATYFYDQNLSLSTSNDANATNSVFRVYNNTDKYPCSLSVSLSDFNITLTPSNSLLFQNGALTNANTIQYKDVGYITIKIRDNNWTMIDQNGYDCDSNVSNEGNNTADIVSCAITGEIDILFIPYEINATTAVTNMVSTATYMANDLDNMYTTLSTTVTAYNKQGGTTNNFDKNCYADDVNLTLYNLITVPTIETDSYQINWRVMEDGTEGNISVTGTGVYTINYTIPDSNFTNGDATVTIHTGVARDIQTARSPITMDDSNASTSVDDYIDSGYDIAEKFTVSTTDLARFWYARAHAPDYRSSTRSVDTPIYVEVYCDDDRVPCSTFGITGLPESSDDVYWWRNTQHTGNDKGTVFRLYADQHKVPDPHIDINGNGNVVNDLNGTTTIQNGVTVPAPVVTYLNTGKSRIYKTRIFVEPSSWLKYNRFDVNGTISYHVEFNLPMEDWAGVGYQGSTFDFNISDSKSNRRLEW